VRNDTGIFEGRAHRLDGRLQEFAPSTTEPTAPQMSPSRASESNALTTTDSAAEQVCQSTPASGTVILPSH
jgi:hypothetical protein